MLNDCYRPVSTYRQTAGVGQKQSPDEDSFPPEAEYHLGLTEIFAEIIYDLIGLRTLAETFLPFEVSRRQHVDYLMIRIEGHNCSGLIIPDTILGGTVATMT
ncbi:hypothetical protein GPK29_24915 [Aeromonas hydrophila]|uniref:hypothetical protein n=1 Tax=Aeromonas hydrophila TaxID=644 RepID=UPI001C5B963B|nr:hypothetical protein [Aeromonas hydrophila]MBW3799452.1 hypothetical protein [Aeromonas hydrophila]MBW3804201.1 hypothetical protein [Aeromonas hydrophila]